MLAEAIEQLGALKLAPMARRLQEWADDPANVGKSHAQCVLELALAQRQAITNTRIRRVFVRADLPDGACLNDFRSAGKRGVSPTVLGNLATCDWVRRGLNLIITGGSRSGKTFLARAFTREAASLGLSVAFWRVPDLLAQCAIHLDEKGAIGRASFVKKQARVDLLVLDDFALERMRSKSCYALRQLLDARDRHERALLVASPTAIADWRGYFEDTTSAEAIFSRVLSRHNHIEIKGQPPAM